jgi:hypothetical protein
MVSVGLELTFSLLLWLCSQLQIFIPVELVLLLRMQIMQQKQLLQLHELQGAQG